MVKDCLGSLGWLSCVAAQECWSCKKLKQTSLHHSHHWQQVVVAKLGIREKELQVHNMLFQAQEENSPISVPSVQHPVQSTSGENSPISIPNPNKKRIVIQHYSSKHKRGNFTNTCTIVLCASCYASLATTSQKRWNSAYKSKRLFQVCSWYMSESQHTCFDEAAFGNV